jgi:ribosome-associated protein
LIFAELPLILDVEKLPYTIAFFTPKPDLVSGIRVNHSLIIAEEDLQWSFARSGGPGGQNVNKVNSKATLRWTPREGQLPKSAWFRFQRLAKRYLTKEGQVVIQAQEHRDQAQNIEACRQRLATLIRSALIVPRRRIKTKPTKASHRRRLDNKRRQGEKKRSRQSKDFT